MTTQTGHMTWEENKLPPVQEVAVATMVFVIIGGIYIAAHLPIR